MHPYDSAQNALDLSVEHQPQAATSCDLSTKAAAVELQQAVQMDRVPDCAARERTRRSRGDSFTLLAANVSLDSAPVGKPIAFLFASTAILRNNKSALCDPALGAAGSRLLRVLSRENSPSLFRLAKRNEEFWSVSIDGLTNRSGISQPQCVHSRVIHVMHVRPKYSQELLDLHPVFRHPDAKLAWAFGVVLPFPGVYRIGLDHDLTGCPEGALAGELSGCTPVLQVDAASVILRAVPSKDPALPESSSNDCDLTHIPGSFLGIQPWEWHSPRCPDLHRQIAVAEDAPWPMPELCLVGDSQMGYTNAHIMEIAPRGHRSCSVNKKQWDFDQSGPEKRRIETLIEHCLSKPNAITVVTLGCHNSNLHLSEARDRAFDVAQRLIAPAVAKGRCFVGWSIYDSASWALPNTRFKDNVQRQYSLRNAAKNDFWKDALTTVGAHYVDLFSPSLALRTKAEGGHTETDPVHFKGRQCIYNYMARLLLAGIRKSCESSGG